MSSLQAGSKDGLTAHRSDVYHPLAAKKVQLNFKGLPETFEVLRQYAITSAIAKGTFGFVALAEDTTMEQTDPPKEDGPNAPWNAVAIKKVRELFSNQRLWLSAVREIKMLRFFNHPNIISARDVMIPLGDHNNLTLQGIEARTRNFDEVYIVMDFMDTTLKGVLSDDNYCPKYTGKNPTLGAPGDVSKRVSDNPTWDIVRPMSAQGRVFLLMQILQGLEYMHACGVVHRDLKPENVLVNHEWVAKVCDFGQGRGGLADENDMIGDLETSEVGQCTQWYAAPEHLRFAFNLNQSNAGFVTKETMHADDVWAVGCIAAEMLLGKPIFDAKTPGGQGQLDSILNVLGLPTEEDLASMQKWSPYPLREHFEKSVAKHVTESRIRQVLEAGAAAVPREEGWDPITVEPAEIELITAMLRWDPSKRITIKEALQSPIFADNEQYRKRLEDFPSQRFPAVNKAELSDATAARKIIWDLFTECHPEVLELQEALRASETRRPSPGAEAEST